MHEVRCHKTSSIISILYTATAISTEIEAEFRLRLGPALVIVKSMGLEFGHLLNFLVIDVELDCHEVARPIDALDDVQGVKRRIRLDVARHIVVVHLLPVRRHEWMSSGGNATYTVSLTGIKGSLLCFTPVHDSINMFADYLEGCC